MAKILVTGATGRVGKLLVPKLLQKGHAVKAITKPGSSQALPSGAEQLEFDLSSGKVPASAFKDIQKIIHLAALVGDYPYSQLVLNNAFATKNLISNMPSSIQRLVIASSISVYGEYKGKTVDESFALNPKSPYGKSKMLAESLAKDFCDRLPITFLRFGMIYGPGFEEGYFQVFKLLKKGKMKTLGKGSNRLPLLHINDAISAILLSLDSKAKSCRSYNITGQEQLTQEQLLGLAAQELGVTPPEGHANPLVAKIALKAQNLLSITGIANKPSITGENIRQLSLDRAYSCKRAQTELGFKARVKIRDGVKEMAGIFTGNKR